MNLNKRAGVMPAFSLPPVSVFFVWRNGRSSVVEKGAVNDAEVKSNDGFWHPAGSH